MSNTAAAVPPPSPPQRVRTRFAPSPTGSPHVGTLRTGLFSWLLAKHSGGDFILRIEDTDQGRTVPGALAEILESFRALGISYDEGPDKESVARLDPARYGAVSPDLLPEHGSAFGPYFQSQRLARYREIAERLVDEGKAYYAFDTPEELDARRAAAQARGRAFLYDRRDRGLPVDEQRARAAAGERYVVRFAMPTEGFIRVHDVLRGATDFDAATQDDFIALKSDGFPTYHLAAMVDDHDMRVSHVIRGEEWQSSTPKHVCLLQALGWEPPVIIHTANINGPDGKKLSKREGAKGVLGYLAEGYLPEALFNFFALLGWSPGDDTEIMSRDEIVRRFGIEGLSRSPAMFDPEKLAWMNGVYIRALPEDALLDRVLPLLAAAGLVPSDPDAATRAYVASVVALERDRLKRLDEIATLTAFFFGDLPAEYESKGVEKWLRKRPDATAAFLKDLRDALAPVSPWTIETIETEARAAGGRHGRERGELTHPIRVAVTGREVGPGLWETMAVLGKDRVLARLDHAAGLAATAAPRG
jgi:glutamyl-tRNA synthetase